MRATRFVPATFLALMLCFGSASAQTTYAELPRFHQVTDRLYRGGQPRDGGLRRLRELGIDTIVNLRGASKTTGAEGTEARALGFNYFNIALPNWGRPQDDRVRRILMIMAAPQNGRVFVHCKDGVDRTGMIVALHRITHQRWDTGDALAEADLRGMRRIQFWIRDYVEEYGGRAHLISYEPDLGDRIGTGMRIVERETLRVRRVLRRVF
jgi:protein tyrosine/serine phosphatase